MSLISTAQLCNSHQIIYGSLWLWATGPTVKTAALDKCVFKMTLWDIECMQGLYVFVSDVIL